ncbi:MAG: TrkH family potassium uptake protein, partial [Candidatus Omnitrophica bacterium]|nr:TrkH family potassium uptake protein [Candidatus Omnitrophota bacterium]
MLLKPQIKDIKIVTYYLGKIIIGLSLLLALPLILGVYNGEINPAFDFAISMLVGLIIGLILVSLCKTTEDLNWMHGMSLVALAWLVAMFLGAIPLFLSGHWKSYLDACFDAMSGFATTGLVLVQDLDHLSLSCNLWRHLMMFIGGQGIVIVALSFFVRGLSGAFKIYVGEGREERVLPNVVHTAHFIWLVSIVYLILGSLALAFVAQAEGISKGTSFFHGLCIFMAAFDTGGFAPQSQNILYYHSFPFELVTILLMLFGAINFKLHYSLWTGNKKEIFKNIETVTLFISIMVLFFFTAVGLNRTGIYPEAFILFRKGFYQLISAHTGTGYMTIYAKHFIHQWSGLAFMAVIIAMSLGGSTCSTTGGIKLLRLDIFFNTLVSEIKRIMLPESSVSVQKFHHIKEMVLEDKQVRMSLLIFLMYLGMYIVGAIIGCVYGYS